jgi:hypothetical protein
MPRSAIGVDASHDAASLELPQVYRVLPDEDAEQDGDLRVIDASGEDYLYPADYFVLVDSPDEVVTALDKSSARGAEHSG